MLFAIFCMAIVALVSAVDYYRRFQILLNARVGGTLEVEYKNLKARAKFHADMGDYAIDDEKFLKALSVPGKHALLFTFTAGGESDLLEGTLEVPVTATHEHGHEPDRRWWWLGALPVIASPSL